MEGGGKKDLKQQLLNEAELYSAAAAELEEEEDEDFMNK